MEPPPAVARPDEPLADAARRLQEHDARCLLVVGRRGELLGLLTLEGLGELFAIRRAVDSGPDQRAAQFLPNGPG
jgi:CBS-domain-containing membrane protein